MAINRGTAIIRGNTAIYYKPATVLDIVIDGSITKTVTGHGFSHFVSTDLFLTYVLHNQFIRL